MTDTSGSRQAARGHAKGEKYQDRVARERTRAESLGTLTGYQRRKIREYVRMQFPRDPEERGAAYAERELTGWVTRVGWDRFNALKRFQRRKERIFQARASDDEYYGEEIDDFRDELDDFFGDDLPAFLAFYK